MAHGGETRRKREPRRLRDVALRPDALNPLATQTHKIKPSPWPLSGERAGERAMHLLRNEWLQHVAGNPQRPLPGFKAVGKSFVLHFHTHRPIVVSVRKRADPAAPIDVAQARNF